MVTLIFAMSYQDFYRAYKDAEELFRKGDYSKSEKIYRKILRTLTSTALGTRRGTG
jgi:hypothetical protein